MTKAVVSLGTPCGLIDIDGTAMRGQLCYLYVKKLVTSGLLPADTLSEVQLYLDAHDQRRGSFAAFIDAFVKSYNANGRLKGLRVAAARAIAKEIVEEQGQRMHVFPRELILAAQDIGMPIGIISGSATEVVAEFARMLDADDFLGTEWGQVNGVFTGGPQVAWCTKKDEAAQLLALRNKWDLMASFAIGDTLSDWGMFRLVGYPICFNPDERLMRIARSEGLAIIFEKKNLITAHRPMKSGLLQETSLDDILPLFIAEPLYRRLKSVNW